MPVRSTGHPGPHIRQNVLPPGLSVKDAAKLLGVGRPALSNLLNGNSSLSPEMALRLEKAFPAKAKRDELMKLQAAYDEEQVRMREKSVAVRTYAPSFLDISAIQIEAWADQTIENRFQLAAFLRRLVLSTGANLSKVDFPAFDNAERPGWDGEIVTDTASPWIPSGTSGWEFGCNRNPGQKAEHDYVARTSNVPAEVQKNTTFVFVTPRNWRGKNDWVIAKQAEGHWMDVRAFDASDLEQWLEQSVAAQAWMAERLGLGNDDILTLDQCWDRWALVTEPPLHEDLFRGATEQHKSSVESWLSRSPDTPLVVTADSEDEALAFIACVLESIGSPPGTYQARALVVRSVNALRRAAKASSTFIPIIVSADVEEASAGIHRAQHTIIVRRRNAVEGNPNIALDLIDDPFFRQALVSMGVDEQDIPHLARASGQSATILRRRLSVVPEIKSPPWMRDTAQTRKLVPLAFAGVWDSQAKADQEIVRCLSDGDTYERVEKTVAELLRSDQSPLWSVGRFRGVTSKIDVLYGIQSLVTRTDLDNFFFIARIVLSERDPSLDLPEDKRYAASLYGKTREHSTALRDSICETLVILAVHGDNLFPQRLGVDVQGRVSEVVRDLMSPPTAEKWASQRSDLPLYAEASPDIFLDILEADLKSTVPEVLSLMKPASSAIFGGGCPRSGLLWALEALAWSVERLPRVASVLAQLSEIRIEDNWANKPENSLEAIFCAEIPQTAAGIEERIAVLEAIVRKYPRIGWRILIQQFDPYGRVGQYTYRPRWRKDAAGAGQPVSPRERSTFALKAVELAINWSAHSEHTLGDLVERLQVIPDHTGTVWKRVRQWIASGPSDEQKAVLRERVRRYALTRRGRQLLEQIKDDARAIYDLLAPSDPVIRNQWLFTQSWVDETEDEAADSNFNYEQHQQHVLKMRSEALAEVWRARGYEGILRLCHAGEAAGVIGSLIASGAVKRMNKPDFAHHLASDSTRAAENCLLGFLATTPDADRVELLESLVARFESDGPAAAEKILRLLRNAPFRRDTWRHADRLPEPLQSRYWQEVRLGWATVADSEELHELISRLLLANRPRAALATVRFELKKIATPLLIRLLREAATNQAEPSQEYRLRSYEIVEALKILDGRLDVTSDDLAQLEFLYLGALHREERGIPNLERQIAESPVLFMQAAALAYGRGDEGEDPPEWRIENEEVRSNAGLQAHRLLHNARRLPGTTDDGVIDVAALKAWISEVRALGKVYGREKVVDSLIGELLSKSKAGKDGVWPREEVREVLEDTGNDGIANGMAVGLYNQRGAHFRGPGGDQERELALKYRSWSKQVVYDAPFTSRLLERIAKTYDHEAHWHDTDANIKRRIV